MIYACVHREVYVHICELYVVLCSLKKVIPRVEVLEVRDVHWQCAYVGATRSSSQHALL
jgi:hypothetical protein